MHQYNFKDAGVRRFDVDVLYYRLKQTDLDKKTTYSKIISLRLTKTGNQVKISPNPVVGQAIIELSAQRSMQVEVSIANNLGQQVSSFKWATAAGSNSRILNMADLPNGIYYVILSDDTGGIEVHKVVKE